jgi:hypothetical protein
MRTADAATPVSGSTGPPGGRDALRLARIVRLVLWALVILLLAGGGLAYSCMPAETAPLGPLAGSLWCGQ